MNRILFTNDNQLKKYNRKNKKEEKDEGKENRQTHEGGNKMYL